MQGGKAVFAGGGTLARKMSDSCSEMTILTLTGL